MRALRGNALAPIDPGTWMRNRIFIVMALIALADWLFYNEVVSISLVLFSGIVGVVAARTNYCRADQKAQTIAWVILIAALFRSSAPLPRP